MRLRRTLSYNRRTNIKVLVLDIETKYLEAAVWGLWNNNVSLSMLLESGMVICWAAKWLNDPAKSTIWYRHDDKEFLPEIWHLLDEADCVLTYNGRKFDLPTLNREFVKAEYGPPSSYRHIDLLETVKRAFRLPSNKLDFISNDLGIGQKVKHEGFELWKKCNEGDEDAWKRMKKYNIGDVVLLEKLYHKLGPWVQAPPNAALYMGEDKLLDTPVCPRCGGKHLQKRGHYATTTQIYQRYWCKDCGGWSRGRYTQLSKEARSNILTAI